MIGRRPGADPRARLLIRAIAAARIALGTAATLAPGQALRAAGFEPADPGARILARLAGVRDIGLGATVLWAGEDAGMLKRAAVAGAAVDAGDSVSFGLALIRREGVDRAALGGSISAAMASSAGAWAASRL